jgi:hypothetical protein
VFRASCSREAKLGPVERGPGAHGRSVAVEPETASLTRKVYAGMNALIEAHETELAKPRPERWVGTLPERFHAASARASSVRAVSGGEHLRLALDHYRRAFLENPSPTSTRARSLAASADPMAHASHGATAPYQVRIVVERNHGPELSGRDALDYCDNLDQTRAAGEGSGGPAGELRTP